MVDYPTSVWDGASDNRGSAQERKEAPDFRDWHRMIGEIAATQTQIDSNAAGVDSNATHTVGAIPTKAGLTVVEKGNGAIHKTIITMASMSTVTNVGGTPSTMAAWGTQQLYTFPEGYIQILGAHILTPIGLMITGLKDDTGWKTSGDYEMGVGTVAAAEAVQLGLDGGTEEDIIAAITCALSSYISDAAEAYQLTTLTSFDGTGGAKELHLNYRALLESDYGTVDDTMVFSGTFGIVWTMLGDN